jgi:hypothetical protein
MKILTTMARPTGAFCLRARISGSGYHYAGGMALYPDLSLPGAIARRQSSLVWRQIATSLSLLAMTAAGHS